MAETLRSLPLTDLSDDEKAFREVVRDFAEEKIRPLVRKMDEESKIPRELIDACFELGIMGIEIPEQYGGAGADLLHVDPRRRGAGAGRRRRWPCWWTCRTRCSTTRSCGGAREAQKAKYFPKLASKWVGAYALTEAGSGSDAFALACRAEDKGDHYELTGQKLWITNAGEAELFIVMANVDPSQGLQGDHELPRREDVPRVHGGEEGGQARHPRVVDVRARPRALPGAEGERARRAGQGLQDRDRDAQRGPHRDRGADGRAWPRGPSSTRSGTRRSGSSSASRSPSSRACSSSSRRWRPRSRRRASSPTTRRACATTGCPS